MYMNLDFAINQTASSDDDDDDEDESFSFPISKMEA